jgi:effector-binding domain-containing protein
MNTTDEIKIVTAPATATAVVRQASTWGEFPTLWPALLEEVWAVVRGDSIPAGRNVMVYLDDQPTVEVGVEVDGPFAPGARVIPSALPAGRAATTVAPGAPSRDGLTAAHDGVLGWCAAHGHELTGVRWEIYSHWHEDPAQMSTEVYWQLK